MNIIEVKKLTKQFGDFTAVNDISFNVEKGQVFAFLGPNGAGKTTTIKMLTTLLKPTAGNIILNGSDAYADPSSVRKSFGIVFQDPSLDDELTAEENMQFHAVLYKLPRVERKNKIEELLKFVELWDCRKNFVKEFSGGMKRRLEIARGLLHEPSVLFLDEPTIGLDPQTRNHIWSYIKNLSQTKQITIFFTTHYMEEAEKVADRVAIIDRGAVIMQGTPDELKQNTKTASLEEAFLSLTGKNIRADESSGQDRMRQHRKMWRGGR